MDNSWYKKAKVKLLGTSQSPKFETAMSEWCFTGDVETHPRSNQVCELCGKKSLQTRFRLKNELNGAVLNVGSSCIQKFTGIEIHDDSGQLIINSEHRRKHLERKGRAIRILHAALQPLRDLYVIEKNCPTKKKILSAVEFYNSSGRWPYEIISLQIRMDANGIEYDRSCYR